MTGPDGDIHTTPLTASCLRRAFLRQDESIPRTTTRALYRGNVAHNALEELHSKHEPKDWLGVDYEALVNRAADREFKESNRQKRPLSAATDRDQDLYKAEVVEVVAAYGVRLWEHFSKCTLLGVEVPVRAELTDATGKQRSLASHVDLVFIGPEYHRPNAGDSVLQCWDYKFRDEEPTRPFLQRNMQFSTYAYCLKHGQALIDGYWMDIGGGKDPMLSWVHLPNLKPYKRAPSRLVNDDDGVPTKYKAGSPRPMHKILRSIDYRDDPSWEKKYIEELTIRGAMFDNNLWPTCPDPVGCQTCDVSVACTAIVRETDL